MTTTFLAAGAVFLISTGFGASFFIAVFLTNGFWATTTGLATLAATFFGFSTFLTSIFFSTFGSVSTTLASCSATAAFSVFSWMANTLAISALLSYLSLAAESSAAGNYSSLTVYF